MGPTKMTPEDQQFNINFLAEVEKHPCLFDSNSTEYKQAQVQDKAWVAVSASVGEGVDLCKKRWRNLRCCMTRYLKSVRDNMDSTSNLRRKPYYLYNHMQFVIPYLKMKDGDTSTYELEDSAWIKNNNSVDMTEMLKPGEEGEEEEDHEIETIDVQEEDHQHIKQSIIQSIKILPMSQESQTQGTTTTYEIIEATPSKQARLEAVQVTPESTAKSQPQHHSVSHIIKPKTEGNVKHYTYATVTAAPQTTASTMYTSTPTITGQYTLQQAPSSSSSHLRHHPPMTSVPMSAVQQQQQQQQPQFAPNVAADADNNFFKSLIPDIQSMNMSQKRMLKIGILRLIDEILSTT